MAKLLKDIAGLLTPRLWVSYIGVMSVLIALVYRPEGHPGALGADMMLAGFGVGMAFSSVIRRDDAVRVILFLLLALSPVAFGQDKQPGVNLVKGSETGDKIASQDSQGSPYIRFRQDGSQIFDPPIHIYTNDPNHAWVITSLPPGAKLCSDQTKCILWFDAQGVKTANSSPGSIAGETELIAPNTSTKARLKPCTWILEHGPAGSYVESYEVLDKPPVTILSSDRLLASDEQGNLGHEAKCDPTTSNQGSKDTTRSPSQHCKRNGDGCSGLGIPCDGISTFDKQGNMTSCISIQKSQPACLTFTCGGYIGPKELQPASCDAHFAFGTIYDCLYPVLLVMNRGVFYNSGTGAEIPDPGVSSKTPPGSSPQMNTVPTYFKECTPSLGCSYATVPGSYDDGITIFGSDGHSSVTRITDREMGEIAAAEKALEDVKRQVARAHGVQLERVLIHKGSKQCLTLGTDTLTGSSCDFDQYREPDIYRIHDAFLFVGEAAKTGGSDDKK